MAEAVASTKPVQRRDIFMIVEIYYDYILARCKQAEKTTEEVSYDIIIILSNGELERLGEAHCKDIMGNQHN